MSSVRSLRNNIIEIVESTLDTMEHNDYIHNQRRTMPEDHFRYEFGTVRISLPRGVGHTPAAVELLGNHPNSLIIVPRMLDKEYIIKEYSMGSDDVRIFLLDRILVADESIMKSFILHNKKIINENYDLLIVDGISRLDDQTQHLITALFSSCTELFVELQ